VRLAEETMMTATSLSPSVTRWLAPCGVLGGLLYLTGDFLFYGTLDSGAFRPLSVMAHRADTLLVAGAIVAPLASVGYILGTLAIALSVQGKAPRLAWSFFVSWSGMFLDGIAYHAVYATRGFAAKLTDPAAAEITVRRIGELLSALYVGEAAMGAIGTIALAAAVLRRDSGVPRWLLVLTPTAWALAGGLPRLLPAPVGSLIAGGWINGWFTIFFAGALAAHLRSRSS
jgi:hypothetical protein